MFLSSRRSRQVRARASKKPADTAGADSTDLVCGLLAGCFVESEIRKNIYSLFFPAQAPSRTEPGCGSPGVRVSASATWGPRARIQ